MPGIMISYRREDSLGHAGRLYDHLARHFGNATVFMDLDDIEPGLDFVEVLQQTVSSCDALVAVIGKQWLTATDEEGRSRLDNPGDLVRVEIGTALSRKVRVIPVLVAGARMPKVQELPPDLKALSRRNALEISDVSFHEGVSRLIEVLEKTLRQVATIVPPAGELSVTQRVQGRLPGEQGQPFDEPTVTSGAEPPPESAPAKTSLPSLVTLPVWRRCLLFYWPRSLAGWLLRLPFWGFGLWSLIGVFVFLAGREPWGNDDWLFLLGCSGATWGCRRLAYWSDQKS
jgi:TIR domain